MYLKYVIEFFLTLLYICLAGSVTFYAEFPDKTEFCLHGWLF